MKVICIRCKALIREEPPVRDESIITEICPACARKEQLDSELPEKGGEAMENRRGTARVVALILVVVIVAMVIALAITMSRLNETRAELSRTQEELLQTKTTLDSVKAMLEEVKKK